MSIDTVREAKIKRLERKIETLTEAVKQAKADFDRSPTKEKNLALCMANLDLANAKADLWLAQDSLKSNQGEDPEGFQPGE